MLQIIIKANQSLRDIAITHYGTLEAIGEIVTLNEAILKNDPKALVDLGIDYLHDHALYLDVALAPGIIIEVNDRGRTVDQNIIRDLTTEQTKYEYGTYNKGNTR